MTNSAGPRYAFFEGKIIPLEDAKVGVMTHAFNYGTGVFEGIRGYWNADHNQLYIFRLREHFERFLKNTAMVCIHVPYTVDQLTELTLQVVRKHEYDTDIYIRPLAYKSSQQIGVSMEGVRDDLTIFTAPYGKYIETEAPLSVCVSSWRRSSDNAIPGRAKVTGNYANTALIKNEAVLNGYDEGIALTPEGKVSEGSAENIFLVRKGRLVTPSVSQDILEGITRDTIIELASNDMGIETEEREVSRTELYYADEIFLTGTGAQIAPVGRVDQRVVSTGEIGPITAQIQSAYFDIVRGDNPKYHDWLTPVNTSSTSRQKVSAT